MAAPNEAFEELQARLARYPRERYPVQHATAQFHLGLLLSDAGDTGRAEAALAEAVELLDPERLPVEYARALNALGAVHRLAGRPAEAAEAFAGAAGRFAAAGHAAEEGAAVFNLGLVRRELGDRGGAAEAFERARGLLDPERAPREAAAAARELGTELLQEGELHAAVSALTEAAALAERAGDAPGHGAAANALGLGLLAAGRVDDAVDALRAALGSHSRSVRPHEYAMVKANLALAYEDVGDAPRARLAARQALGVPGVSDAVATQAQALLERLGAGRDDLFAVLEREPVERRLAVVREDVVRWADCDEEERRAEAAAWVEGQLAHPDAAGDLAEVLLGALLELPPAAMDAVASSLVVAGRAHERFREDVGRAARRFAEPQALRLEAAFAWT